MQIALSAFFAFVLAVRTVSGGILHVRGSSTVSKGQSRVQSTAQQRQPSALSPQSDNLLGPSEQKPGTRAPTTKGPIDQPVGSTGKLNSRRQPQFVVPIPDPQRIIRNDPPERKPPARPVTRSQVKDNDTIRSMAAPRRSARLASGVSPESVPTRKPSKRGNAINLAAEASDGSKRQKSDDVSLGTLRRSNRLTLMSEDSNSMLPQEVSMMSKTPFRAVAQSLPGIGDQGSNLADSRRHASQHEPMEPRNRSPQARRSNSAAGWGSPKQGQQYQFQPTTPASSGQYSGVISSAIRSRGQNQPHYEMIQIATIANTGTIPSSNTAETEALPGSIPVHTNAIPKPNTAPRSSARKAGNGLGLMGRQFISHESQTRYGNGSPQTTGGATMRTLGPPQISSFAQRADTLSTGPPPLTLTEADIPEVADSTRMPYIPFRLP